MGHIRRRVRGDDGERGVYAVLYAALVLVMIAMAAIVVDLTTLKQSRRDDRAAADAAAIAGAQQLDPGALAGSRPRAACEAAWSYLQASIRNLKMPSGACTTAPNNFPVLAPTTCPTSQIGGPVKADGVEGYYVTVTWPVLVSSALLTPDVAPGGASQTFSTEVDGTSPCERLGISVQHDQEFLLGPVLDVSGGTTLSSSVARIDPEGGPNEEVAALNVLNRRDCDSLVTLGGGKVVVGPTIDGATVLGPGIIAVEADGNGSCSGPNARVIAPNTSSGGSLVCASLVDLNATGTNCDGKGMIRSHALDPGGQRAYSEAAITNGNLKPTPVPEGGQYGWNPVTKIYGCVSLSPCAVPMPATNYIGALKSALGGAGIPTSNYSASAAPYVDKNTTAFAAVPPEVCANIKTPILLAAGNWYANCHIDVQLGGSLIVQGGTLVIEKGISVASGGCFVMNAPVPTCTAGTADAPPLDGAGTTQATTAAQPLGDAILYLRGNGCPVSGCFSTSGKTIMPQTFVYSAEDHLTVKSTDVTLWTAPGAGKVTAGKTTLEVACSDPTTGSVIKACLDSRFSRLAYWSEFAAPSTKPNDFAGQGSLSVIGVFFMPRGYFDVSGGGAYAAASAQFWADQIRVTGGANLGLRPDPRTAIPSPTSAVRLIR